MKKNWLGVLLALSLLLGGCAGAEAAHSKAEQTVARQAEQAVAEKTDPDGELESLKEELNALNSEHAALQDDLKTLQDEKESLENELNAAEQRIVDFSLLEEKYGELSDSEIEAATAENERKAEEDRKEREKILAEEAAEAERIAREEAEREADKEKQGYDTGISFSDIARNPDDFILEKVKFDGTVVQVMEGDTEINLRVAIDDDYDKMILVYYPSNLLSKRVLEDDEITLYGTSMGLYTYESTLGGNITVPLVEVDRIDF